MPLERKTMAARLLLDVRVDLKVRELGELPALAANEVVMMPAVGELVAHAPVFQRHAADEVQLLEQFNRAEDGRPSHPGESREKVFDREWRRFFLDSEENGPPRLG